MAPMMMKVGMLLFLALSIHAAAPRKQGNACENSQNGEFTKVTANNYKETSAVTNEEKLYDCSTRQTTKGVLRCLEGQWTKCARVCGRPVSTDANAYLENKETSFAPGVRISYSCAVGYALSGGNQYRRCLRKTFTWSPLTIKCERSSCGSAGEILNGEVIYTGVEFVHTATTVCAKGYLLVGKANRTCLSGGWDGRPAFCEAVQCTKPKTNTEILGPWKASYTYRQALVFHCREGTLVGQKSISCSENATWSAPPPVCKGSSCGSAGEILNGEVIYTGVEFGHTATTVCAKGYLLVGKANRTCLSGGWDERPAFCEAVQCTKPETNTETLGPWKASYAYRQVLMFRCRQGTLVGQKAISCSENATWSAPPPVCKDVECPRPNVPHSSLSSGSWRPPFRYRSSMTFSCDPGYVLVGQASVSCSQEGRWTPALPQCIYVECPRPNVPHSSLSSGSWRPPFRYRSSMTFSCDPGYVLVGQASVSCSQEGRWTPALPQCIYVECPRPNVPHSSLSSGSWRPPFRYRSSMTFSCDPGYVLVGQASVSCSQEGRWTPALPQCIYVECPRPNVPHSSLSGLWRPPFRYRSWMTFSCNSGYVLVGQASVSCSQEGTWTPALPQCIWYGYAYGGNGYGGNAYGGNAYHG
ncbi:P-selectin isoform X2 [Gadus morhua]|uniref:P-selectin isoform X2 n=1 Tax=Gadus morhua TaxID=8049 RepID=UPI0011B6FCE5|nr:P-selectin-like isoform X2 [Gadus morhua]